MIDNRIDLANRALAPTARIRKIFPGCTFKGKLEALPWFVEPAGKNVFSLHLASLLLVLCKNGDRKAAVVR